MPRIVPGSRGAVIVQMRQLRFEFGLRERPLGVGTAWRDGITCWTELSSCGSGGPPPWDLYAVAPITVFGGLTVEPGGATRWRFDA
jgi:hypothetical protein